MTEQLNIIIGKRVKEVLQYHLQGTTEDYDAATEAVLGELSFVGGNLQGLVDLSGVDITTTAGRSDLTDQLVELLKEAN
jgi:hypothetical protein